MPPQDVSWQGFTARMSQPRDEKTLDEIQEVIEENLENRRFTALTARMSISRDKKDEFVLFFLLPRTSAELCIGRVVDTPGAHKDRYYIIPAT
jgi:hypothetical protein